MKNPKRKMSKICETCGELKHHYHNQSGGDGTMIHCADCVNARGRKYRTEETKTTQSVIDFRIKQRNREDMQDPRKDMERLIKRAKDRFSLHSIWENAK